MADPYSSYPMTEDDLRLIAEVGGVPVAKVRGIVYLTQLALAAESLAGRSGGGQALRASGSHQRRGVGASRTEKLPLPKKPVGDERGPTKQGDNADSPSRAVPARIGDVEGSTASG